MSFSAKWHSFLFGLPAFNVAELWERGQRTFEQGLLNKAVNELTYGQFTIPSSIRRQLGLNEGDFLAVEVNAEGIHLRPKRLIDASQAWFWTDEHQAKEREAEAEIAAGKVVYFNSVDDLMKSLDEDE